MASSYSSDLRFAILIDADNISDKYMKIILDEVANSGVATYKRIYGDWTSQRLASWKGVLLENSIIPMQQYSYTYGKSSTDSAMIIDAMDILYSGNVDGFAIVSSDSDFTRLAARLRESGMHVIGMGEQKTPLLYASRKAEEAVEDAGDEDEAADAPRSRRRRRGGASRRAKAAKPDDAALAHDESDGSGEESFAQGGRRHPGDAGGARAAAAIEAEGVQEPEEQIEFAEMSRAARRNHMKKIRSTINAIVDKFSDDEGSVPLDRVGDELSKRLPDFDVRNYGFKKLRPFLKSLGVYDIVEPEDASGQRQIFMRLRDHD